MKLPTLSVTVQNYNHAKHLPNCLDSILQQSLQPFEILVLDDASTDDSVEVIRGYERKFPHLRLIQNERNLGAVGNVNRAVELVRGDYIFSSAADDRIAPGFFEKSIWLLAQHPQAGLCCTIGDWRELDTGVSWHMGVGMTDKPAYISPQRIVELEGMGRFFIPGHTAIFKRSALIEAGQYDPDLRHFVDWFATSVVAYRYGICVVPEPLAIFNIESNTYYQRNRRNREFNEAAIEHALKLLATPAFADVAGLMQRSGALYVCGPATLRVLLRRKEYRGFLTFTYLRKMLWHTTRISLKRCAPTFLLNWYVGLAGYRAPTTKA